MTNQDALIPAGFPESALSRVARDHIDHLKARGVLRPEHELSAALVLHLAGVAGTTGKGYAAAQVCRELREAIAALPQVPDGGGDDLAGELDELVEQAAAQ